MSRGELWWVDFGPSVGTEVGKRRPAVIVGRDAVVRATLEHESGTVSVTRLVERIGRVPERVSRQIDDAIRLYLGL